MTLNSTHTTDEKMRISKKTSNQRIFFIPSSTKSVHNSTTNQIQTTIRCDKCGIPLQKKGDIGKQITVLDDKQDKIKAKICHVCRREQFLNRVLVSSYVISAMIFVLGIVGVFLREISLDFVLLIGCLEIIFLLFWGRFLEEAVFFGLSRHDKLLSALYRYSVSAEIQNFEVALKYLSRIQEFDDDLLKGFLQVTVYQANNLPTDWFYLVSEHMKITQSDFIEKLTEQIDEEKELDYLEKMLSQSPPSGISLMIEILTITENKKGLTKLASHLDTLLSKDTIDIKLQHEFYIYKQKYITALESIDRNDLIELIENNLSNYKEPRVPTIDVIESGKGIIQKNPLFRYLIRIFFYIGLAFLLGLIYRLLE
ncbi:MAG: hypothetical protein FK733_07520 [Asgard group archaeon]|nr:hypothetical protein [Asgard group archaeon]